MRLPDETIERVLAETRGLADWLGAWNRGAQRHLSEARREDSAGRWYEAALARRNAAMCYHAAHLVTDTDVRTVRALRASAVSVFAQAIPHLMAETRKVQVPWRAAGAPGYLALSTAAADQPAPLAVLLNGATTTKEELLLWSDRFLERGIAVLALDWPGTGECYAASPLSSYCEDLTDGIIAIAENEPAVDESRVALVGFSLGGAVAIRAAAQDRRIAACVSVTGPYDPRIWIDAVNPIVRQQLVSLAGDDSTLGDLATDFAVNDVVGRLYCPFLALGAGRDLVIPPEDSLSLAAEAGDQATLVWYGDGSHGLYDYVEDWTDVVALWLWALFSDEVVGAETMSDSTQVDVESGITPGLVTPAAGDVTS